MRLRTRLVELNAVREVSYFALKSTEFIILRSFVEYVCADEMYFECNGICHINLVYILI